MDYELLAQVIVDDTLREADKNRLTKIANRSRKTQRRQRLAKMARRFGSIRNRNSEGNSILQQQLEVDHIKKMTSEITDCRPYKCNDDFICAKPTQLGLKITTGECTSDISEEINFSCENNGSSCKKNQMIKRIKSL